MLKDKLTFAFSLSFVLVAACSSSGDTVSEDEAAEAEAHASANEKRPGLRQIDGSEPSEDEAVVPAEGLSRDEGYLPPEANFARPPDARAFCATSRDTDSENEQDPDTLPLDVRQSGMNAWRCMNRKAMVCNLGATGRACWKTGEMDTERLEAFEQFCRQRPDSNHIPHSLTTGLASEWRCDYMTPVQTSTFPTDRMGYFKHGWQVLN